MGKEIAKEDYTYCTNTECTKDCWRKASNYMFNPSKLYSFQGCCEEMNNMKGE